MYYALISFSALLFTLSSFFTACYQKHEGATFEKAIKVSFLGSIFSIIMLFIMGIENISFSFFSFIIALIASVSNLINITMTIKVFEIANLTIYSLFSQIGGMLLPTVVSIAFYGETLTIGKVICLVLLTFALIIGNPIEKSADKKSKIAYIYYFGVFITNGIYAALSKVHQAGKNAVSGNSYTLIQKSIVFVITAAILIYFRYKKRDAKLNRPLISTFFIAGSGLLNTFANLILLYALLFVDASVQYPLVTGGIIVFAIIFDFIRGKRPTAKSLISAAITCVAMIFLTL